MLKRILALLSLLFCTPFYVQGQQYQHSWSNSPIILDANSNVKPHDIQSDANGNVITVGTFIGNIDFSDNQGSGFMMSTELDDEDIFIKKCDSDGNFLWVKRIGGVDLDKVSDMDIDPEGNIYISGYFMDNIDFDPSILQVIAFSGQANVVDGFIAKYSPEGEHIWSKPYFFDGNNPSEGIKYDEVSNTIYSTGAFRGPANFNGQSNGGILQSDGDRDIYLVNLSPDGVFNWVRGFGSVQDDYPSSLEVDGSGRVYISGTVGAELEISGQTVGDNNVSLPVLVSFDGPDDQSIVYDFTSPGNALISDLSAEGNDLWLVGTYTDGLMVDGLPLTSPTLSSDVENVFILKSSLVDGTFFVKNISGTQDVNAYSITDDGVGQAVIVGGFEGTQDFDWTPSGSRTLEATGSFSPFLLGILSDGSFSFADKLENSAEAYLNSVAYAGANTYLSTGIFNGSIDLALNTFPSILIQNTGIEAGYEIKLKNKILAAICKEELELDLLSDELIYLTASQVDDGSYTLEGGSMEFSLDTEQLDCSDIGEELIVNMTVTDVVFDVTETCQSKITLLESVPPVAICQDFQLALAADGMAAVSVNDIDNGSYDNCAIDTILLSQDTFSCDELGLNTIILTLIDQSGNSAECQSELILVDAQSPQLICQDLTLELDEEGEVDQSILFDMILATDECGMESLNLNLDLDEEDLCSFPSSGEAVELIATDKSGNSSSCTLNLKIVDNISPSLSCRDLRIELADVDDIVEVGDLDLLEYANDNCGIAQLEYFPQTLSYDDIGDNDIEIMLMDSSTNFSYCLSKIRLLIRVSDIDLVYVPNVFSPNNDGVNDQLAVFASRKVERITQFTILDRWGNVHYETKDEAPDNNGLGWTGQMGRENSPKGVYLYSLRVLAIDGEYYDFSGTINLL